MLLHGKNSDCPMVRSGTWKRCHGHASDEGATWGMGPVTLDITMAMLHGWTEEDIAAAKHKLADVSFLFGQRAQMRHPDWYDAYGRFVHQVAP